MEPASTYETETRTRRAGRLICLALFLTGAAAYAFISIYRHDRFASAAFDLGIYDQLIWGYSHFQILYNTVALEPNMLGDHFHPILMLLAPLYWIWNDVRVLLLAQAVLLSLASIPIFWLAYQRLGLAAAAMFQATYLIFWGILAGVVFDFHQVAVAVPAVSFALYAILTRNSLMLWPATAVGLLSKEDISLTFLFIGIYVLLTQRRWKTGVALVTLSTAYFLVVLEAVMPAIRGGPYGHWTYTALGPTPGAALKHVILKPWDAIRVAVEPFKKVLLVGALFTSWIWLPVLSPIVLITIPLIAERVWSDNPMFWSGQYQYSMVIAPVLAFGAIDGLHRLGRVWRGHQALLTGGAGVLLLVASIVTFGVVRPLDEMGHYVSAQTAHSVQSCLDQIPASASVTATDYLVPHLTHRSQIYLARFGIRDAKYVAAGPGGTSNSQAVVADALKQGYRVACRNSAVTLLSR